MLLAEAIQKIEDSWLGGGNSFFLILTPRAAPRFYTSVFQEQEHSPVLNPLKQVPEKAPGLCKGMTAPCSCLLPLQMIGTIRKHILWRT